jgi:hypothetical protein
MHREWIACLSQRLDDLHRSIRGDEIEQAVIFEIKPHRTESGERQTDGANRRSRTRVAEDAGPVVDVEVAALRGQLGHHEIFVAIVVVVAGIDAHAAFGLAARG